jgi:hypothetical protein
MPCACQSISANLQTFTYLDRIEVSSGLGSRLCKFFCLVEVLNPATVSALLLCSDEFLTRLPSPHLVLVCLTCSILC